MWGEDTRVTTLEAPITRAAESEPIIYGIHRTDVVSIDVVYSLIDIVYNLADGFTDIN